MKDNSLNKEGRGQIQEYRQSKFKDQLRRKRKNNRSSCKLFRNKCLEALRKPQRPNTVCNSSEHLPPNSVQLTNKRRQLERRRCIRGRLVRVSNDWLTIGQVKFTSWGTLSMREPPKICQRDLILNKVWWILAQISSCLKTTRRREEVLQPKIGSISWKSDFHSKNKVSKTNSCSFNQLQRILKPVTKLCRGQWVASQTTSVWTLKNSSKSLVFPTQNTVCETSHFAMTQQKAPTSNQRRQVQFLHTTPLLISCRFASTDVLYL